VLEEAVRRLGPLDRETAARAAILLARLTWTHGDRAAVSNWLARADELLADLPHSIAHTEALVARSGFEMVASEYEQAIRSAREALDRMQGVDRPDLRARAFDVIGVSRVGLGDEGGMDDQQRAVEFAREGRAIWELHHAINNRGAVQMQLGLVKAFERNLEHWRSTFEELPGTAHNRDWFLAAEVHADYSAGRWDAALGRIEGFLAELGEGATHYLESTVRPIRASIELARERMVEAMLTSNVRSRSQSARAIRRYSG
jgi:hypothetical protein